MPELLHYLHTAFIIGRVFVPGALLLWLLDWIARWEDVHG
jgi:hypothetical protein